MTNLKRARQQMSALKNQDLVDSSLDEHFKELNCSEWNTSKREEYSTLYPVDREPTVEEEEAQYAEYLESLNPEDTPIPPEEFEYKNVAIEYTYCEWVPVVPEQYHYDEEGNVVIDAPEKPGYYTPDNCTFTFNQWLGDEVCPDYDTANDIANFKSTDVDYRIYSKWMRAGKVDRIRVTTIMGNEFDGDELSQTRLSRAIAVMDDIETILWVLANNTVIQASKAELTEALRLAGEAQTRIWAGV